MRPLVTLMTFLLLMAIPSGGVAGGDTEFGPAAHGLRLGLRIASTRESDVDHHEVTLTISNVATGTITLVADWSEKTEQGDFADWVRRRSRFECEPPWPILTVQTMWSGSFEGQQPRASIPAGGEFSASWRAEGIHL